MSFLGKSILTSETQTLSRISNHGFQLCNSGPVNKTSIDDFLPYGVREISSVADNVFDCASMEELCSCIKSFNTLIHGTHCSLQVITEKGGFEYSVRAMNDYGDDWISTYIDRRYYFIDPIIEICRNSTGVFFWDDVSVRAPMVQSYMAAALSYGIGPSGVTFAANNNYGDTCAISYSSDISPSTFRNYLSSIICDLCEVSRIIINVFSEMSLGATVNEFRLTDDQIRVLYDVSHGLPEEHLSRMTYLFGSYENVKESILRICGAKTLAQAAVMAMKHGMLENIPPARRDIVAMHTHAGR